MLKQLWKDALVSPDLMNIVLYGGAFFVSSVFLYRLLRPKRYNYVPARDISKGHIWGSFDLISVTAYCNICKSLIVDGWVCDSCGVCTHKECCQKADKSLRCKSLSGTGTTMKHHLIPGNLSEVCEICNEDMEPSPENFRCCWCQRNVHRDCKDNLDQLCDFGRYKSVIVPPFCVKLKMRGIKGRRYFVVGDVRAPDYRPWSPLIVIANKKSGNNEGDHILRAFRSVLNPAQVIDLNEIPPEAGLEWCNIIPGHQCRILVGGGDGTVSWVLNAIDKLKVEPPPQVGIIPLGTGNDLARVLGWGSDFSGEVDIKKILDQILSSEALQVDRWKVRIQNLKRRLPIHPQPKEMYMTNYCSIGVDAQVAFKFHQTRDSMLYFSNRLFNKFLYLTFGTKEIFEHECKNLNKRVVLKMNGEVIELPEIEGIVLLNIPSWGAGVQPWSMGNDGLTAPPQKLDDGLIEVIGLYSSFHIAQLSVGLSEPHRFGQAHTIEIQVLDSLPMQVDGEPWIQKPGKVEVTVHKKCTLMANRKREQLNSGPTS